jgi:RNA polymerase sigma-70 factor, ECF subfamily
VLTDPSPSPLDVASQAELKQKFERALQLLTPEQRAILVLREWQGLSYEELAETLKLGIGTVMSRLFYARKKLGEILGMKMKEAMR